MYLLFIWGGMKWIWGGTNHNEGHFRGGGPKNRDFFGPLNLGPKKSQLNQRHSDVYSSAVNFSRGLQPWRTQDDTLGQVRKIWAVWFIP